MGTPLARPIAGPVTSRAGLLLCCLGLLAPPGASAFDWWKAGSELLEKSAPGKTSVAAALTDQEIGAGLREALKVGTERVVARLGRVDGYNADPELHIPLPDSLGRVRSVLGAVGKAELLDDLELKLNRAAEQAAPEAKQLFWDAIAALSVDDARAIYDGPQDAATRYFQGRMAHPLAEAMTPIVSDTLGRVGAVQAYDAVMGQYRAVPFVPDVKADLTRYAVDKAVDGVFHRLAIEEAAIRRDPAKRTTELLTKVFGARP